MDLYAPLIFHWGISQGLSRTDAGDLVQDVLAILVVKLPEFEYDPKHRFRGWLRTITVNRVRDHYRKRAVRKEVDAETQYWPADTEQPGELFEKTEYETFLINRALELMQNEFREDTWRACWKFVVEGESAEDVARDLGISINAVYLAKSRVIRRLREELEGLLE